MEERLKAILKRYHEIESELMEPEVMQDFKKVSKLSKERSDLEGLVKKYDEYKDANEKIVEAKILMNDIELREMAEMELEEQNERLAKISSELEILLIPKDENDGKNVIMEIRGAAGGDEANIFAGDLFRMYTYYAEKNGWKIEVTNEIPGSSGGFSQVECMIKGNNVYSKLSFGFLVLKLFFIVFPFFLEFHILCF